MLSKRPSKEETKACIIYLAALSLAVWAVVWDIRVMDALDEMRIKTQAALRLTAVAVVEDMEAQFIKTEASYEMVEAQSLEEKAKRYYYASEAEEAYAERARQRAEYYERFSVKEQAEADALFDDARQTEQIRLEIIHNMTRDQQEQNEIIQEMREINAGLCEYKVIGWLCQAIGGAGDLQREADDEYVKIQHEWAEKERFGRKEFLEKLVGESLQKKAIEYNNTASDLFFTAEAWEKRSQEDIKYAADYNKSAEETLEAAERLEQRGENDKRFEQNNLSLAEKTFIESELAFKRAIFWSFFASIEAIVALFFFLPRSIVNILAVIKSVVTWASSERTSEQEFWRCATHTLLHLVVFFLTVGLTAGYVGVLDQYQWNERAAIVAWFSVLASWIQTITLHTLPHVLAEWPVTRSDVATIVKTALVRFALLAILFGLELVFIWVNFGKTILSQRTANFFGHWLVCFLSTVSLGLYICYFEPRQSVVGDSQSYSSLLTDDETEATISEATPLTRDEQSSKAGSGSGATANAFMTMDLGSLGQTSSVDASSHYSLDSCSPYFVNVNKDLVLLLVVFEILMASCMIGVLVDCLPLAYHSVAGKVVLSLFLVFLFTVTCTLGWLGAHDITLDWSGDRKAPEDLPHVEIVSI